MSSCGKCSQSVSRAPANPKLLCKDCNSYYHPDCVKIKESDLAFLKDKPWSCPACVDALRMSRLASDSTPVKINNPSNVSDSPTSIKLIEKLVGDLRSDSDSKQSEVVEGLQELKRIIIGGRDKVNEWTDIITKQSEIIDRQQTLIDSLKKDVESTLCRLQAAEDRLQTAEERIDNMEQYSRRSTLEIHGVPEVENEQVMDTLAEVGKSIGLEITQDMVGACHRLQPFKGKPGTKQPPPSIIVKFVRSQHADQMMEMRRKRGTLERHHIGGFSGKGPVFINCSLTSGRRKLLGLACRLKREQKIKDAWVDQNWNDSKRFLNQVDRSVNELVCIGTNVRSLRKYCDTIDLELQDVIKGIDVIILSEVNLNSQEISLYGMPGYGSIFKCRQEGRGVYSLEVRFYNMQMIMYYI
ncbi:uncharacterized protein LOC120351547 [Nilaparvata lugens]|uniref:uncharacterized protein LOC120351547 n=1 Tax=Nilaparvata lugens TaxID=108931 RepID=UPI00193CB927|nr:uncharacterized protein LOC120351547 [Nilaparvata lugens]